jgi:hypothetical protein
LEIKTSPQLDEPPWATSSDFLLRKKARSHQINLTVLGWICITLFKGGGAFLPKRTTGATARKQKGDPSSFIGSGPSSRCGNKNGFRKDLAEVKRRNVNRKAVPLQRECHTRDGSAVASDPKLFGKREFSTSPTTPQSRQPKR